MNVQDRNARRRSEPHEDDELIDIRKEDSTAYGAKQSFPQMILENLKTAGVQQAHKGDRITFTALTPWPGELVCAEGRYLEGEAEKRGAMFIGPEFGTVQRADLVAGSSRRYILQHTMPSRNRSTRPMTCSQSDPSQLEMESSVPPLS